MLTVYLILGGLGAGLILLMLLVGGSDVDADADADVHVDGHVEADAHADAEAGGDVSGIDLLWLPFLSIRFWTFCVCFFGVTGAVLTLMGRGFVLTLIIASAVGVVMGWLAAFAMKMLSKDQVSSSVTSQDYVGLKGKIMVPVGGGKKGQVRCFVKGTLVDLVAECDGEDPLPMKTEVLIVAMKDTVAKVVPAPKEGEAQVGPKESQEAALPPVEGSAS